MLPGRRQGAGKCGLSLTEPTARVCKAPSQHRVLANNTCTHARAAFSPALAEALEQLGDKYEAEAAGWGALMQGLAQAAEAKADRSVLSPWDEAKRQAVKAMLVHWDYASLTILSESRWWHVLFLTTQVVALHIRHPIMGQVVLKVVPETRDTGVLQNIREIQARLALPITPLFVTIEESWTDVNKTMYALSRYAGKSAKQYLQQHTFNPPEDVSKATDDFMKYLACVMPTLLQAQKLPGGGLAHRDIKPDNLLLDTTGPTRLWVTIDWGLSQPMNGDDFLDACTPTYWDTRMCELDAATGQLRMHGPTESRMPILDKTADVNLAMVTGLYLLGRYPEHLQQLNDAITSDLSPEDMHAAEVRAATALYDWACSLTPDSPEFEGLSLCPELRQLIVRCFSPITAQRPLPGDFLCLACLKPVLQEVMGAVKQQGAQIKAQRSAIQAHMAELLGDEDSLASALQRLQDTRQMEISQQQEEALLQQQEAALLHQVLQMFAQLPQALQAVMQQVLPVPSNEQILTLLQALQQLPLNLQPVVVQLRFQSHDQLQVMLQVLQQLPRDLQQVLAHMQFLPCEHLLTLIQALQQLPQDLQLAVRRMGHATCEQLLPLLQALQQLPVEQYRRVRSMLPLMGPGQVSLQQLSLQVLTLQQEAQARLQLQRTQAQLTEMQQAYVLLASQKAASEQELQEQLVQQKAASEVKLREQLALQQEASEQKLQVQGSSCSSAGSSSGSTGNTRSVEHHQQQQPQLQQRKHVFNTLEELLHCTRCSEQCRILSTHKT